MTSPHPELSRMAIMYRPMPAPGGLKQHSVAILPGASERFFKARFTVSLLATFELTGTGGSRLRRHVRVELSSGEDLLDPTNGALARAVASTFPHGTVDPLAQALLEEIAQEEIENFLKACAQALKEERPEELTEDLAAWLRIQDSKLAALCAEWSRV